MALYEMEGEKGYIFIKGSVRMVGMATQYPDVPHIYKDRNNYIADGVARLVAEGAWEDWLSWEMNGFALGLYNSTKEDSGLAGLPVTAEHSGFADKALGKEEKAATGVSLDWANFTIATGAVDLKLGRQPVNLASTFYFTPNDFFAPFGAEAFYRVYKAGVDAVRLEAGPGSLTQITLLAVAGYSLDPERIGYFQNEPDPERTSFIARISTVAFDYEFSVVGGKVRRNNVYGGSFQGTFFDWLGVRMEGHYAYPLDEGQTEKAEVALELERRFQNSLDTRIAVFHHGGGVTNIGDYTKKIVSGLGDIPYLAKWNAAAGASYEFTPLTIGSALALANLVDGSFTLSLNVVYSLSDEGELFAGVAIPFGKKPERMEILSEHGARPITASLEIRYYF